MANDTQKDVLTFTEERGSKPSNDSQTPPLLWKDSLAFLNFILFFFIDHLVLSTLRGRF